MDIVQLEKIVNDGLLKYKAFKDADIALSEIKCLIQAKSDLSKEVEKLKKETADLKDSKVIAVDDIAKARAEADNLIDLAGKKAVKIVEDSKLASDKIVKDAETVAKNIDVSIATKSKELSDINALIAIAKEEHANAKSALEKLKAMLG